MNAIRTIFIVAAIAALSGCAGEPSDGATPPGARLIQLTGHRVVLSYGMPISAQGTREHLPEPDEVTLCAAESDGAIRDSSLSWKLEDFTVVVPAELESFRKESLLHKGVSLVRYEPRGDLRRKKLSLILDSRGKLRQLDFRGSLRIDLVAKTIHPVLPEGPTQDLPQPPG